MSNIFRFKDSHLFPLVLIKPVLMTGHNQRGPPDVEEEPCILPHRSDQHCRGLSCHSYADDSPLYVSQPPTVTSIASMKFRSWCHFTFSDTITIKHITWLWQIVGDFFPGLDICSMSLSMSTVQGSNLGLIYLLVSCVLNLHQEPSGTFRNASATSLHFSRHSDTS